MSCFKETREAIFFFFLSLSFGFGIQFCVVFLFLSFKRRTTRAQRECARAVEESFWARCCVVLRYTYICIVKERKKERERNWMSMMCVWVRETAFGCRREKREKRSSFYKTQDEKGGDNRIFFQEGRCGYLGLFFFSFFKLLSLCCVLCADMKNVFLLLLTSNTNHT